MFDSHLKTYEFTSSLIPLEIESETPVQIINKLKWIIENKADNSHLYNQLDYEYLSYLLITYPNDVEIQSLLHQIFTKVSENYIINQKVLKRRELSNDILSDRRVSDIFRNKQRHWNMRYLYWDQTFDKNLGKEPK